MQGTEPGGAALTNELAIGGTVPGHGVVGEGAVAVERGLARAHDGDPRVERLRQAVARLRRELAGHPADLPDRAAAEDELAVLDAMVSAGFPEVPRLRHSLLLVAGAVGSVSALAAALREVRTAVDAFVHPPER